MALALPGRRSQLAVTPGQAALIAGIALFLLLFLIVPVATVIYVAFTEKGTGAFTLVNFADFARTDLFVRSFWNSVYVSAHVGRAGVAVRPAAGRPSPRASPSAARCSSRRSASSR